MNCSQMDLSKILELISTDQLSIEEVTRCTQAEPRYYNCGTCKFFKGGTCNRPGFPPRPEHALSARCIAYQKYDPRDEALPLEATPSGSRMFK